MNIPAEPVCAIMSPYFDMYLKQLFSSLGHLTAGVLTTAVVVPMATFYWPQVQRLMNYKKYQ
jgi:hypothetical protein